MSAGRRRDRATSGATITIDTAQSNGSSSGDTLDIDVSNFALLNTYVNANGGELTINFTGGDEAEGTPEATTDTVNVDNSSGTLGYGLTIQSSSAIESGASITATNLTLSSSQTATNSPINAPDVSSTGLFTNVDTGITLKAPI